MPVVLDYEPRFLTEQHVVGTLRSVKESSSPDTLFHDVRSQFKPLNIYLQDHYQSVMTRDEFRHIVWAVIQVPLA